MAQNSELNKMSKLLFFPSERASKSYSKCYMYHKIVPLKMPLNLQGYIYGKVKKIWKDVKEQKKLCA